MLQHDRKKWRSATTRTRRRSRWKLASPVVWNASFDRRNQPPRSSGIVETFRSKEVTRWLPRFLSRVVSKFIVTSLFETLLNSTRRVSFLWRQLFLSFMEESTSLELLILKREFISRGLVTLWTHLHENTCFELSPRRIFYEERFIQNMIEITWNKRNMKKCYNKESEDRRRL